METLPNASQFSPKQTALLPLLRIVAANEPDRAAITEAIRVRFFPASGDPQIPRNTVIAMREYGIVEHGVGGATGGQTVLTDFGRALLAKGDAGDDAGMHLDLARHAYLHLHGIDVATVAEDLAAGGHEPTKARIIKELGLRGIYHPPNGTHGNGIRQWFEAAGLVERKKWLILPDRLKAMLDGTTGAMIDRYGTLTKEQRDFARAFARLGVAEARSNEVARYASSLFQTEFPEGGLPQSVLFALRDAGLIEAIKTTTGRGAKPYIVRATPQLQTDWIEPLLDAIEGSSGVQYRKLIRMPYADVLRDLKDPHTGTKGIALEALAFFLARLLGLRFVEWRMRSKDSTGGGEIDVLMEGDLITFSRWQIQCKNTKDDLALADVAKEIGLAQVSRANVVLFVTTSQIGPVARQYIREAMERTNLFIATLDGKNLLTLRDNPGEIATLMREQSEAATQIKRSQLRST